MPKYPTYMSAPVYTPITPVEGGLVHATSIESPFHTACGRVWRGWKITPERLSCEACGDALASGQKGSKQGKGKRRRVG